MARTKGSPKTGGRQRGTPNKTTATIKAAIQDVYDQLQAERGGSNGHFLEWAKDQPTEFYKLVCKLLPLQIDVDGQMSVTRIERKIVE